MSAKYMTLDKSTSPQFISAKSEEGMGKVTKCSGLILGKPDIKALVSTNNSFFLPLPTKHGILVI